MGIKTRYEDMEGIASLVGAPSLATVFSIRSLLSSRISAGHVRRRLSPSWLRRTIFPPYLPWGSLAYLTRFFVRYMLYVAPRLPYNLFYDHLVTLSLDPYSSHSFYSRVYIYLEYTREANCRKSHFRRVITTSLSTHSRGA
jgi:hypothetical protein